MTDENMDALAWRRLQLDGGEGPDLLRAMVKANA